MSRLLQLMVYLDGQAKRVPIELVCRAEKFKMNRIAPWFKVGGREFERFLGASETDRPLTEEHRGECFSCHERRKMHDFVFSEYPK